MRTVDRSNQSDVNDPGCVKTREAFVGAQQKKRACVLSESFMRGRRPVRIYLLPERPAKRFSRTQDPLRTHAMQTGRLNEPLPVCSRFPLTARPNARSPGRRCSTNTSPARGLVCGGLVRGGLVSRSLIRGSLVSRSLVRGGFIRGGLVSRSLVRGGFIRGGLVNICCRCCGPL